MGNATARRVTAMRDRAHGTPRAATGSTGIERIDDDDVDGALDVVAAARRSDAGRIAAVQPSEVHAPAPVMPPVRDIANRAPSVHAETPPVHVETPPVHVETPPVHEETPFRDAAPEETLGPQQRWQTLLAMPYVLAHIAPYIEARHTRDASPTLHAQRFLSALDMTATQVQCTALGFFHNLPFAIRVSPNNVKFWRAFPLPRVELAGALDSTGKKLSVPCSEFADTVCTLRCYARDRVAIMGSELSFRDRNWCAGIDADVQLCTALTALDCRDGTALTDACTRTLTRLTYLDCGRCDGFTDACLLREGASLAHRLTTLHCGSALRITDAACLHLTALTALRLGRNQALTDEGVRQLSSLRMLACGWNTNLTDAVLGALAPTLTALECGRNNIFTPAGMQRLTRLTRLVAHRCTEHVDDAVLLAIGTSLRVLELENPIGFPSAGVGGISDTGLLAVAPSLTALTLDMSCHVTNVGVGACSGLVSLHLPNNSKVSSACLLQLPLLEELSINASRTLPEHLSQCTRLRRLQLLPCLSGIAVAEIDAHMRLLTRLEYLSAPRSDLSDAGIRMLTSLTELACGETNITREGVLHLRRLKRLDAGGINNRGHYCSPGHEERNRVPGEFSNPPPGLCVSWHFKNWGAIPQAVEELGQHYI